MNHCTGIYLNNESLYRNIHKQGIIVQEYTLTRNCCTEIFINKELLHRNIHKQGIIVQEYT